MPDTLRILKTIRAIVADCDPQQFNVSTWWNYRDRCGCLIGLSIQLRPELAAELELDLMKPIYSDNANAVLVSRDFNRTLTTDELAERIGVTPHESDVLFSDASYPWGEKKFGPGKREALRRLDDTIFKYEHGTEGSVVETVG